MRDPDAGSELIRRKRDGGELSAGEIEEFVAGITDGSVTDAQVGALAMAIVWRGMSGAERVALTGAMMRSGDVLDGTRARCRPALDRPVLDKHSTGGVGDKVSLLLAPIVAACGGAVPMISGRGLGHTGGTLDKLESIPGYDVRPTPERFREVVGSVGCAIIGQTGRARTRRQAALRDPRCDRHRRVAAADRRLDPLQEARRRARRAGDGRQGRLRRVPAVARATRASWRAAIVDVARGNGLADQRAADRHEPGSRAARPATRLRCASRSRY